MTQSDTTIEQPADRPERSGVDLARVALHAAREAAKKRGASQTGTPRRRRAQAARRDGREPSTFATAVQGLMADRAWELPTVGGTVLDRWPDIASTIAAQLPQHVQAVAFHPDNGQLDLCPDSPAYATQLRLISARIIAAANEATGQQVVRTVRVLAVRTAVPAPRQPIPPTAAAPETPVKTREMASDGYHRALAAHQSVRPRHHVDPAIAEAVERQTRAMRDLSRRAFPEPEADSNDQPSPIEATRDLALRPARAERAARQGGQAAAVPQPQSLRTTA